LLGTLNAGAKIAVAVDDSFDMGIEMSKMNELTPPSKMDDDVDSETKNQILIGTRSDRVFNKNDVVDSKKKNKKKKKGRKNNIDKKISARSLHANIVDPEDHGMDIFDTTSGNGFVNPLNSHASELAQPVIDDTVDVYTDDATGL